LSVSRSEGVAGAPVGEGENRMTTRKHLKRRARARSAQTGQPYASALRVIRREQQENPMSSVPTPAQEVMASCSFCGKADNQVTRIVAGPGVFICNECVDLCATIISDDPGTTSEDSVRRRRKYLDRPVHEILAMLPALRDSAARADAELARWVRRLRERGTDWPAIAGALDMSVETARQRFEVPPST
jgi:ClpX C4-type zinc finger